MDNERGPVDSIVDAWSEIYDLKLPPDYLPGIVQHLSVAISFADEVMAFELPDEAEPAPIYEA